MNPDLHNLSRTFKNDICDMFPESNTRQQGNKLESRINFDSLRGNLNFSTLIVKVRA